MNSRKMFSLVVIVTLLLVGCSSRESGPMITPPPGGDAGPSGDDAGSPDAGDPMPGTDAGTPPGDDAGGDRCAGRVESDPYPMVTSDAEFTDPESCATCPGAFTGVEELSVGTVPAGTTTIPVSGMAPGATSCEWYVVGSECGITHGRTAIDPDGSGLFETTLPIFCGVNIIRIVCEGAGGSRVLVRRVDAGYCDGRDLRVTLTWGDEANDLELHLIREPGTINSETDDCTWTTCVHEVMDWGMPGLEMDNPRKDIDHLGTLGPENIYLDEAPAGTYDVMVEYWGSGEQTTANVAIAVREVTIATEVLEGFKRHFVWHVGQLTFPEGRFTPINNVLDCNEGWTYPGCGMSLPAR